MKIIDAFWDTRNLGVRCAELVFSVGESIPASNDLKTALAGYEYIAAKVPAGNTEIADFLQREGFTFAECSIGFEHDLGSIGDDELASRQMRMTHRLARDGEEEYILGRIEQGLFCTDRSYLDPFFGHGLAARRYVEWLKDELARGAQLYDVFFDNAKVGFFSYKEIEEGVSYPFLIGLYPENRGRHLSANLVSESLLLSRERGCHLSRTVVSSNNIAIIKAQEAAGSRIYRIHYVLTKHQ